MEIMPRPILDPSQIHDTIQDRVASYHVDVVEEVAQAIASHALVVVGMAQNPHCRRARRALTKAGVAFHDMEYGSYLGQWRRRSALKMWTGWPTFPMVFHNGVLIGGATELERHLADGLIGAAPTKAPEN